MATYIAVAAITLDGKIALHAKHYSSWTSKADKDFLHKLLDTCQCVIVGNNTYKTAIQPLSKRNCIVLTRKVSQTRPAARQLIYCNPGRTNIKQIISKQKYKRVAVLGGAGTYAWCLKNRLFDELYLTLEPLAFGRGISLLDNKNLLRAHFKLLSARRLNEQGTLLLHYKKLDKKPRRSL